MQRQIYAAVLACASALFARSSSAAPIIFDDFNTNLGHFTSNVFNASGSDSGLANTSTNTRDTGTFFEGTGSDKISLDVTTATPRLRHLSGGGTPANNVNFATSAGADGWIGLYMETTAPGWNVQIYMEPGSTAPAATGSNGGIPKNITADGQWHLYEWNLDDNTGDADGWGTISGIVTGVATVGDGNHTIDSIVLRNPSATSGTNSTLNFDFLALNPSGHVSDLVPEPASFGIAAVGLATLVRRRRR